MKNRIRVCPSEKKQFILQIKNTLVAKPEIVFAYLHGSAIDEELIGDIDIAVYFYPHITQLQQIDITLSLSTQLSSQLGVPIDIRPLNQASVGFRFHVTAGELLFSHDENIRLEFVESTWREYQDFKPLMEQNLKDLLEA